MPVNEDLLTTVVADFGFEREYASKCIESNRHNHITATYHLINKRNKKNNSSAQSSSQSIERKPLQRKQDLNVTMPIQAQKINLFIDT